MNFLIYLIFLFAVHSNCRVVGYLLHASTNVTDEKHSGTGNVKWEKLVFTTSLTCNGKTSHDQHTVPCNTKEQSVIQAQLASYAFPIGQVLDTDNVSITSSVKFAIALASDVTKKSTVSGAFSNGVLPEVLSISMSRNAVIAKYSMSLDITYRLLVQYSVDTDIARYPNGVLELDAARRYCGIYEKGDSVGFVDVPAVDMSPCSSGTAAEMSELSVDAEFPMPIKFTLEAGEPVEIQTSWSSGTATASGVYCIVHSSGESIAIGGSKFSFSELQGSLGGTVDVDGSIVRLARPALVSYSAIPNNKESVYVIPCVTVSSKYNGEKVDVTSSDSSIGKTSPTAKYTALFVQASRACKAFTKAKISVSGANLSYIDFIPFECSDGFCFFDYQNNVKMIIKNNGKSFSFTLQCSDTGDSESANIEDGGNSSSFNIPKKIFYISCSATGLVVAILTFLTIYMSCKAKTNNVETSI